MPVVVFAAVLAVEPVVVVGLVESAKLAVGHFADFADSAQFALSVHSVLSMSLLLELLAYSEEPGLSANLEH